MGLRKDMGIPDTGDVRLRVSLELVTNHPKDSNKKQIAKVSYDNVLPMLLKATHLKNAERLFSSHLKDMAVGQFQTDVVCLINKLIKEELAQDKSEPEQEMMQISESSPGEK